MHETITQFSLEENNQYSTALIFVNDDLMPSTIFPDFQVQLSTVFPTV
jgi:Uma2 family endonuclease